MMMLRRSVLKILGIVSLCGLLTACGGAQIEMQSSYPLPLVRPLPVHGGLLTDEAFSQYKYEETIDRFGDWSIALGKDQRLMFEQTMRGLFNGFSHVEDVGLAAKGSELILKPRVAAFEISIPEQTQTEFFEVRIVYEIEVLDSQGREVLVWNVSAYGRSDTRNYRILGGSGSGSALTAATRSALRDASALISRQLPQQPKIQAWLAELRASKEG